MPTSSLRAVIWDFDGTLVDTRHKNLAVTRTILERLTGRAADEIVPLRGLETYEAATRRVGHWRELYISEFGLSAEVTEQAGHLWEEAHLEDPTPSPFFDGVAEVLTELRGVPQGVVSQNSGRMISRALDSHGVRDCFDAIIGYESVSFDRQKPHPEGLLLCLERLSVFEQGSDSGAVLFVGDHEVDTTCARRANQRLEQQGAELRIVSVGAAYGGARKDLIDWHRQPDHAAHHPRDISRLARELGAEATRLHSGC